MDTFWLDTRYALRRLRSAPAFAAIVIATLAVGIGANTAMFSIVDSILIRPLAYREPERLMTVDHFYPTLNNLKAGVSIPGFYDYTDRPGIFSSTGVSTGWAPAVTGHGDAQRLTGERVSTRFFQTLGISAQLGRVFLDEEGEVGRNSVVVLGDPLWRRLFGGSRDVIGQKIILDGAPTEIVGVMPAGFRDPYARDAEIWSPFAFKPEDRADNNRTNEFLTFVGRLKPEVTLERARSTMHDLGERLKSEHTQSYSPDWTLLVTPLAEKRTGSVRSLLLVLLGSVGCVLLIACANVANLLLARGAGRSKEVAVRAALGAERVRLVRQLLTESMVLALIGGAFGLALAVLGVRVLAAMHPANLPRGEEIGIDPSVLAFSLLVTLATGALFGLAPALQASKTDLNETLKEGGRHSTGERSGRTTRRALVVSEMALALMLLAGAGLLIRSLERLQKVDPGFEPHGLLTVQLTLPALRYASDTPQVAFYNRLLPDVSQIPGVRAVGATSTLPFSGGWSTGSFNIEGYQPKEKEPTPWGDIRVVSPGFLSALGAPLRKGRMFTDQDDAAHPQVAVVDDEMVRRYWPHEDPIGKRLYFEGSNSPDSARHYIQVIGVVGHTMHEALDADARVQVYLPYAQNPQRGMSLVVRTASDPEGVFPAVRAAVQNVDRDVPISRVQTMQNLVEASVGPRRLSMWLLGAFAGIAMFLAALGIYGIMSYAVAQRRRDIGVRIALGAEQRDVLALILRQGMTLAAVGIGAGALGALALTRLIRSQLYGVSASDPLTFIAVILLLAGTALAATWIPALRATRVDPAVALRQE
ncbi:MAG TPA: ABC transporter permease [Gemmatimonadaceae bacterium]|nr:ABC transporter permease [Gemmatimonadaceae bacterium]